MTTTDRDPGAVEHSLGRDPEAPSFWRMASMSPGLLSLDWRDSANRLCEHVPAFQYTESDDWALVGKDFERGLIDVAYRSPDVAAELEVRLKKLVAHYRHVDGDLEPDIVAAIGDVVLLLCDVKGPESGAPGGRTKRRSRRRWSDRSARLGVMNYEGKES